MHSAAYDFVKRQLDAEPCTDQWVLELGSYNVNGSVRELCTGAAVYTGVDIRPGPGVDIVVDLAHYDAGQAFDLVISTEVMEHLSDPRSLLECAWRALSPGGRLILTAAGPGRPPHGIDGGGVGDEHYQTIAKAALDDWLSEWEDVCVLENTVTHDVYAIARKPE